VVTQPDNGDDDFAFPYEAALHAVFPKLHDAQSEWLGQLDSLTALDRKTHELVRLACVTGIRNFSGVERHAQLAREVGATWEEVVEAIVLTQPSFGVLPAVQALPVARRGFDAAQPAETD
jgi:alkylhydroperoxidase/carboxymuconolactone decarboxylase family protein YurZ